MGIASSIIGIAVLGVSLPLAVQWYKATGKTVGKETAKIVHNLRHHNKNSKYVLPIIKRDTGRKN